MSRACVSGSWYDMTVRVLNPFGLPGVHAPLPWNSEYEDVEPAWTWAMAAVAQVGVSPPPGSPAISPFRAIFLFFLVQITAIDCN